MHQFSSSMSTKRFTSTIAIITACGRLYYDFVILWPKDSRIQTISISNLSIEPKHVKAPETVSKSRSIGTVPFKYATARQ